MGSSNVFANKQGITHKGSGAESISGPDVCLTPVGKSQVPIPYTNVARSSTLARGSKSVFINGHSVAINGCCYSSSTGDQPGTGKGVISGTVGGKAEFATCSFDVKIEGRGVCRNGDLMVQNNGNALGWNRDSCAEPPPRDEDTPPVDTVRIMVVEHLSWEAYDKKAGKFYLGHEKNRPIANRAFKFKPAKGQTLFVSTDAQGIIELSGQDPHGRFELTFEPEKARLNKKYFLFSRAITPFKKDMIEQDDPGGARLSHTKDDILTGVNYVVSIYQPCVIVDGHMHIQSGRCAPLPFLWSTPPMLLRSIVRCLQPGRVTLETTLENLYTSEDMPVLKQDEHMAGGDSADWGPPPQTFWVSPDRDELHRWYVRREMIDLARNPTDVIGTSKFMERMDEVLSQSFLKSDFYARVPHLLFACVVMTMDMEFAHIDGYYGIKVYNAIYRADDPEKKPIGYWTPLHGRWLRDNRSADIYSPDPQNRNPLGRHDVAEQTEADFARNRETMKSCGVPGVYFDGLDRPVKMNVDAAPFVITEKERPPEGSQDEAESRRLLYEQWKDQVFKTKLAVVSNPLKLLPLYHYDPRRWQVHSTRNDEPFRQVGEGGLFLGFKMYSAQGYRPWDVRRLPVLLDFYARCCVRRVPVVNHCTPLGAPTFDRSEYLLFRHPMDTRQDDEDREKYRIEHSYDGKGYFNEHFVSPRAWEKVLEGKLGDTRFSNLRLCLAHFGGASGLGIEWMGQIIELMKKYPHVYTDISSSMAQEKFRDHFRKKVSTDGDFKKLIRHRVLFGSDWYLTMGEGNDYRHYCEETKRFLDEIDSSLWVRFTQVNPYKFYRLDEQIRRIANAIIDTRREDKKIRKTMEEFSRDSIADIFKAAAYIERANQSFTNHEVTQKK